MVQLRRANERGHAKHDWLDTYHTFSFADYHDPKYMGYSALRVINEDVIEAGAGFPTHSHLDMEILTFVIEGALEHKDSMGNTSIIKPGEVQYMSAGTGVSHSEFNHFKDKQTKLLQMWVMPDKSGYAPTYDQKSFADSFGCYDLVLVASGSGKSNSIKVRQDIDMFVGHANQDTEVRHLTQTTRKAWLQMVAGEIEVNGNKMGAGDGAAISEVQAIDISAKKGAEFILFNLP